MRHPMRDIVKGFSKGLEVKSDTAFRGRVVYYARKQSDLLVGMRYDGAGCHRQYDKSDALRLFFALYLYYNIGTTMKQIKKIYEINDIESWFKAAEFGGLDFIGIR